MTEAKSCPDCNLAMEEGFVPDFAFNNIIQMLWHPGKAEPNTVLGIRTGSLKLDQSKFIPTTAHRCPKCGLVRTYACDGE